MVEGPWGLRDLGFGYDELLRLRLVRDMAGEETGIHYDSINQPDTVFLPTSSDFTSRLRMTYGYQAGRVQSIGYSQLDPQRHFGRAYGYDALDRIETITRAGSQPDRTEVRTLVYDALGRLQSWQDREHWVGEICLDENDPSTCTPQEYHEDLAGETYTYDRVGNRTDHGAVIDEGNRLLRYDGYTLEYDDDGNLTRKSGAGLEQTFTWSALGELTSVTTNGVTTTYGYDALGRRVRKTLATGTTTRYLWNGDDLVMELGAGNAVLREYSYYPGIDQPHAVRIPAEQDRIYYYLPELPGHVAGLTSEDYPVANVYRYTPFGEPIETGLAEWATQPLGFGARERDGESGMYYVRARYYDPELGRFISEDP